MLRLDCHTPYGAVYFSASCAVFSGGLPIYVPQGWRALCGLWSNFLAPARGNDIWRLPPQPLLGQIAAGRTRTGDIPNGRSTPTGALPTELQRHICHRTTQRLDAHTTKKRHIKLCFLLRVGLRCHSIIPPHPPANIQCSCLFTTDRNIGNRSARFTSCDNARIWRTRLNRH